MCIRDRLQEAGVTLDNELQRLDELENEADQRLACVLIDIDSSTSELYFTSFDCDFAIFSLYLASILNFCFAK